MVTAISVFQLLLPEISRTKEGVHGRVHTLHPDAARLASIVMVSVSLLRGAQPNAARNHGILSTSCRMMLALRQACSA